MQKSFHFQLQARPSGDDFKIIAISAGEAKGHGLSFTDAVLKESLPLWDGIPCMLDHDWMPSVTRLAGIVKNPTWDETEHGIQMTLVPNGPGAQVLKDLQAAVKSDHALSKVVGFSAVVSLSYKASGEVIKVNTARSVDCVIDPARGGKFLSRGSYMLPSATSATRVAEVSRLLPPSVISALRSADVRANPTHSLERRNQMTKKTPTAALEEQVDETEELAADEIDETEDLAARIDETAARLQGAQAHVETLQSKAQESTQILASICRNLLATSLSTSRLPSSVTAPIKKRMLKLIETDELDRFSEVLETEITEARSMLSELTASETVQGPSRLSSFTTGGDQFSAAVYDLMSAPRPDHLVKVKATRLSGIREMYILGTGDRYFHGGYDPEAIHMFATTASLPNLLTDALNKLVHDNWNKFAAKGYGWWRNIVRVEHSDNIQDVKGILLGQTDILPTVAEGDPYDELEVTDSKESAAWVKKGAYLGLTLEMFLKDDTRKLRAFPRIIGNSGIRTISAWIAGLFTANAGAGPVMADTGNLFNATAIATPGGHANLLTAALDATAWEAVCAAMYGQPMLAPTGADGGVLAVEPAFCLTPRALKKTAWDLFKNDWVTTDNKHATNLLKDTATPLVVPEWTDAKDYAAVADPDIAPAITVTEIFGLEPELFIAGSSTDPAMFENDESRIKARHLLNVLVEDFRPLHKSNVT
jgi:hypothetical protein